VNTLRKTTVAPPRSALEQTWSLNKKKNDLFVVTRQSFIPDIWLGEEEAILDGDSVLCLLLGTSDIQWHSGAKTMALCLVLKLSTNREGAFERIGVMMCDSDSRIFRSGEDSVIELVWCISQQKMQINGYINQALCTSFLYTVHRRIHATNIVSIGDPKFAPHKNITMVVIHNFFSYPRLGSKLAASLKR